MKKTVTVCMGSSCVRNCAKDVLKNAKRLKGVRVNECSCLGLCSNAPNIVVEGKVISNVNPGEVAAHLGGKESVTGLTESPALEDAKLDDISDLLNP